LIPGRLGVLKHLKHIKHQQQGKIDGGDFFLKKEFEELLICLLIRKKLAPKKEKNR